MDHVGSELLVENIGMVNDAWTPVTALWDRDTPNDTCIIP